MSEKHFENFIVTHFLEHAQGYLKTGRYQFRSPDAENSKKLFTAFTESDHSEQLPLEDGIALSYLNIAGIKLIPVLHCESGTEGFTENFISYLRDEVSGQQGEFENTALLVIHNSLLDTLINSAEDIAAPGGIFDPERIRTSLEKLIDSKDSQQGQEVSRILLDYQYELITEDKGSMFGFETLHEAIRDGDIRFHEIDLVEDPAVLSMENPQQIRKRLDQNKALFDKISEVIEHYPDQISDHLTEFSDGFIQKNFNKDGSESWKQVSFDEYLKEQELNREQNLVLADEKSVTAELIARSKGESKAAQRERHLLIVVDEDRNDFDVELAFQGAKLIDKEVTLTDKSKTLNKEDHIQVKSGSVNSSITLTYPNLEQPLFFQIILKRGKTSENYKFKCLAVKRHWFNTESIRNCFVINPAKQLVTLQTQETELQIGLSASGRSAERTVLTDSGMSFDVNTHQTLDFENLANEVDRVTFELVNGEQNLTMDVEGAAATETLSIPVLLDSERKRIFKDGFYGVFNHHKQKVYLENKELKANKSSLDFLRKEYEWVDLEIISADGDQVNDLLMLEEFSPELYNAYQALYTYYQQHKTLPSLCGWGPEYQALVKDVVSVYHASIADIEQKSYLSDQEKAIVHLGTLKDDSGEWITPFHPLVLAYYLQLVEVAQAEGNDDSFFNLPTVTRQRLNPQGLLPYLYDDKHDFSYVQASAENSFWLHCVPHQETNYAYVTKLVKEKIREFTEAFRHLFDAPNDSVKPTLFINSINNYENREIFQGIVDHIILKRNHCLNIHVNLYDDNLMKTEFDLFSEMSSYEQIKQRYGLNKGKAKDYADTIVDLLRTRVSYSKFTHDAEDEQAYGHLSFFRNNQKVAVVDVNPEERLSGVTSHGLISGEASASEKGNYITGFGLQNTEFEDNPLLQLVLLYSRLIKPARKSAFEYRENSAIALAVDDKFKAQLEKSYKSSVWTSIIDPKVTLDFFEQSQNMLLIHYSDQYTSSAGYDAITVTRQTQLYDRILQKEGGGLVSEFNAFNGEWLLKMITDNEKIRKEKKGILTAYKLISCLLSKSEITWVPMSIAEMVRVSGNIGLNMSESEFSRHINGYRSGSISDDVLFVGFKDKQLYLLPLEVKTGQQYDATKAIKQADELHRYLTELLSGNQLATRLYRSLFVRQALMQIDKYQLYHVYADEYFQTLLDSKEWWLQGDYTLADIADYPKGFVVANLENETCFSTSVEEVDDILKLEVPASFINSTISAPLQQLWQDAAASAAASIPDKYFLGHSPLRSREVTANGIQSSENSQADATDDSAATLNRGVTEPDASYETDTQDTSSAYVPEEDASSDDGILKILIGHDVNHRQPVYWEPTNTAKFMNTNSGIIGTMGTGKTQCTKSVVTQLYRNQHLNVDGKSIGMLIFDYKSDYVDDTFLSATGGKKYNLHKLPYNPLSLFGNTPMLPVHTARAFSETMGKAFGLGQKQMLKLRKLIGEAYELAGIHKADASTWTKPAPTITDVWELFINQEKIDEDSLYAALESLYELEIFEDDVSKCTSLYNLVDGIRVVELAGYPPQIQNLVVALTLDLFYSQMQKQGKPEVRGDLRQITKMILVDEADNFMSQDFPSLRKVLKEGREYGVGIILSTQDITHFKTKDNDYSAYILSWVVHRVSQIKNQDIKSLFNKDDKSDQEILMKEIRELEKHHSLYVNGDKKVAKIKDKAFWEIVLG